MTATTGEFRLPDVGEGLTEAEIVTWRVAVGDEVAHNDVLVEIETAKSLVELPSPYAGTVTALLVEEGATVPVGTPIVCIGSPGGSGTEPGPETPVAGSDTESDSAGDPGEPAPSVLVGYGPSDHGRTRRRRRTPSSPAGSAPSGSAWSSGSVPTSAPSPVAGDASAGPAPRATPLVRRLAKDRGIELSAVRGTGPAGRIVRDDVLGHLAPESPAAPQSPVAPESPVAPGSPAAETAVPTADETRVPVRGVRKAIAAAMVGSAFTAPHVTEFLTVDVTRSVTLVERLRAEPALEGSRVTFLLLAAKALLAAAREFPEINASWDEAAQEIVLHHRVNLGIAAATPRGLMVPNIKDAGALTLPALAAALTDLVRTAREGRSTPEDMSGGTITITNIGVFGVDAATPILNPGEAAILCLGAVRRTPWEHKGRVALRWTTQLALSFDHRLVDGELGSRVLARTGAILRDPRRELLLV